MTLNIPNPNINKCEHVDVTQRALCRCRLGVSPCRGELSVRNVMYCTVVLKQWATGLWLWVSCRQILVVGCLLGCWFWHFSFFCAQRIPPASVRVSFFLFWFSGDLENWGSFEKRKGSVKTHEKETDSKSLLSYLYNLNPCENFGNRVHERKSLKLTLAFGKDENGSPYWRIAATRYDTAATESSVKEWILGFQSLVLYKSIYVCSTPSSSYSSRCCFLSSHQFLLRRVVGYPRVSSRR